MGEHGPRGQRVGGWLGWWVHGWVDERQSGGGGRGEWGLTRAPTIAAFRTTHHNPATKQLINPRMFKKSIHSSPNEATTQHHNPSSTNQVKALLRSRMLPMSQAVYGQSCRRGHSCLIGVLFLVVAFECRGLPMRLVLDSERLGVQQKSLTTESNKKVCQSSLTKKPDRTVEHKSLTNQSGKKL